MTLLSIDFFNREQVSLLNAVFGKKILPPFTVLLGGVDIATVILTQLHVSSFHLVNTYMRGLTIIAGQVL